MIQITLKKLQLPGSVESWRAFASSGRFILLLDGFDEVDPALADRTISDIETEADLFADSLQILVTSRPDADIQKSSKFRVCKLQALDFSDHEPFLTRICEDKSQAANLFQAVEKSSAEVRYLLTTPLMMTLLVILYKSLQTIPDTVPRFYEELFDVLFYRHDQSKPGFRRKRFTTLDDTSLKKLFSAFCFYARLHNFGVLTQYCLVRCFLGSATRWAKALAGP